MLEGLKSIRILSDFNERQLNLINENCTPISYENGALIFLENEESKELYLVESGIIKIFKTSLEGKELILYFVTPGDTINEAPLATHEHNYFSAQALGPVGVFRISKDKFREIVYNEKTLWTKLIDIVSRRLRKTLDLLGDFAFKKVTMRVAKTILEQFGENEDTNLNRRISKQEIAAMVGTSREVVHRSLRDLEENSLIKIDRHQIIIRNIDRLKEVADIGL